MSALLAGHAASLAALGLALLLVALIAVGATLTIDLRASSRGRAERRRRTVMDERIRARLEATIWPD